MQSVIRLLVICVFVSIATTIHAQTKFVNEFLNIGVGGEAHGKFGSVVATVDDVTAGYWNPAGLAHNSANFQASAMHANWFGGIANYDYISFGKRFGDEGSFGSLSLIRMGIDNIPYTLNLINPDGTVDYNNISEFSAADYALLASYGRKFNEQLSIGGSVKVINRSIGSFATAWGFGFDIGAQYRMDKLSFGAAIKDVTSTFNAWSFNLTEEEKDVFQQTNNDIPVSSTEIALPRLILGAAYTDKRGTVSYSGELNLNISTNGTQAGVLSGDKIAVDPTLGIEIGYNEQVFIRAGFGNIQRIINDVNGSSSELEFQPNIGMGINLGRIKVDYALANVADVGGALKSHIFSVVLDFNARSN